MPKRHTQLDELDIRLITDFPMIVDVFVTTMSRIQDIVMSQFKEVESVVSDFIGKKKNYSILSRTKVNGLHKPFYFSNNKQILIDKIIPYYRFESYFDVISGDEEKEEDKFQVWIGFEYDPESDSRPYFFYFIAKWDAKRRGTNFSLKFYQTIKALNSNTEVKIGHPDNNSKEEFVQVNYYGITNDSINEGLDFYLDKVLKPYLQQLKW